MRGGRIDRLTGWTGRRATLAIGLIGSAMLLAYLTAVIAFPRPGGRAVFGDATHHFVQLRSIVFDRDLHFRNDYIDIYDLRGGEPGTEWIFADLTDTGYVRNYMPVGPALLWMPLYLAATLGLGLLAAAGLVARPDGFEAALQIVPGVTGIAAATVAAWLSWRLARTFTDDVSAAVGTIGVWVGSHALYYSLVSPAYSHTASMLTSTAFFAYWIGTRDAPSARRAATWGALAGLAALMRWQDALLMAAPAIDLLRWRAPWSRRLAAGTAAMAGWLVAFSPQMVVWTVLYGQPFALPQGPSFMQWTSPHPFAVLFSDNHGLFTWAPLLVPAVIGLGVFVRRQHSLALPVLAVVAGSWYVNASVADWWAGEAYGARRFLSLFPLFSIGLATWVEALGRGAAARTWRHLAVGGFVLANLLLLLQYQCFMKGLAAIAPYPRGWFDMWVVRVLVPFRLAGWWLQ